MRRLNQKGSFIIMLTLSFALLGTFIGFTVDFGRAYLQRARVNRLVDGAALAAAKALKGQAGLINEATRAACDSMKMNGAPVEMTGPGQCKSTKGAPFTVNLTFPLIAVAGGAPITYVQITGSEPVSTTFMRFLGWMVPGDYSTINVAATAQAAPERPLDLVLVLDRSGSMGGTKIAALKTTVNDFLDNNFTGNDRIGMVSFASRGCGNASGGDNTGAIICQPDVPMADATSANINTLKNRVNGLNAANFTNTMEALRTARVPLAAAFSDATRATTRKVVLLVTDGKPTLMRRDNDAQCKQDPKGNAVAAWSGGSFPNGCLQYTADTAGRTVYRITLNNGPPTNASDANGTLFRNTISCFRSFDGCAGTNGAMYEADLIRNCGYGNSGCTTAGAHDVLVFAIGIGVIDPKSPSGSFDRNARCMLARIANSTDVVNTGPGTIDSIDTVCKNPPDKLIDGDTYLELQSGWPCGAGPCINTTQEKGRVYYVDQNGNVQAQMQQVFAEIAAILKLRLTM
jgi:Flp pilus assembly protein TadG